MIGGGPAGLMAAEMLLARGCRVSLFDAKPSLGRKFLMAGRGGLNLTHSEPLEPFLDRYGDRRDALEPALRAFNNEALRAWAEDLGIETFVGSSGRVFPREMKAAPLLRAWLTKLRAAGLETHTRHRWTGWTADGRLRFETPDGSVTRSTRATVLALGGGSWPRLGSDGAWVPWLAARGVEVAPLRPSNCGFDVAWSDHFKSRFAGEPVKAVTLAAGDRIRRGEFIVTETGVEGGSIYALSAPLRDEIENAGRVILTLDLAPDRSLDRLREALANPRGAQSASTHLTRATGLKGVKTGLLRELAPRGAFDDPPSLAGWIKALPLPLLRPRPMAEVISSAGGVSFDAVTGMTRLRARSDVFVAGEMQDWEAPTGGYLLTACFALGRAAGLAAAAYLLADDV